MRLTAIHIQAFINHMGMMSSYPGLETPFGGSDIQDLVSIRDRVPHHGESLPEDLQIPDFRIALMDLFPVFR
jgi:hypothetical protein